MLPKGGSLGTEKKQTEPVRGSVQLRELQETSAVLARTEKEITATETKRLLGKHVEQDKKA